MTESYWINQMHGDEVVMTAQLMEQNADPAGLTPERHPCDVGVRPA